MPRFGEPGAPERGPGGRPKVHQSIRDIARQHGPEAIAGLLELARGGKVPAAVRRQAWSDILDRGFGRPTVGEPDDAGQQVARIEYTWAKPEGE